jgi:tetratricopeptide (TPR) repeat protein
MVLASSLFFADLGMANSMKPLAMFLLLCAGCRPSIDSAFQRIKRGHLDQAESELQSWQPRVSDPGWIAYDLACVQLQQGQLREAELNFYRALSDPSIPLRRQIAANYNLGIVLLKSSEASESKRFLLAIEAFETVLRANRFDPTLTADASVNLELAKRWYQQSTRLRPKNAQSDPPNESTGDPANTKEDLTKDTLTQPGKGDAKPKKGDPRSNGKEGSDETASKNPGAGNLPVVLDSEIPQPISQSDAFGLIRKLDTRLQSERMRTRKAAANEKEKPNDW